MGSVLEAYRHGVAQGHMQPDPGQAAVAGRLDDLAGRLSRAQGLFGSRRPVRGLYLWGGVGRGKSMLMDLFFAHAPVSAKRRVHFLDFMQDVHENIDAARQTGTNDPIAQVARRIAGEAHLLCLDEFQVNDIADAMVLKRLFEGLTRRRSVVVATSNRAPSELYKDGLNRQLFLPFIDWLEAKTEVVEIEAARDYRLERLTEAPVWVSPLGAAAEAAMERAWERLSLGRTQQALHLGVKGRELVFPHAAGGVVRTSFASLCDCPLGPADYLALAAHVRTLILEGVPRLTPERRDVARRFVTLIDALYEAKVKLVASAEAEPEALYPEGDGAFEFQRTVSRLHEMRSVDYLGAEPVAGARA